MLLPQAYMEFLKKTPFFNIINPFFEGDITTNDILKESVPIDIIIEWFSTEEICFKFGMLKQYWKKVTLQQFLDSQMKESHSTMHLI